MTLPALLLAGLNDDVAYSVSQYLRLEGFMCVPARTGDDVLTALRSRAVAGAILDMALPGPGPDVVSICRQLRLLPRAAQLPIIVLAASGEEAEAAEAAGATKVFRKPFHVTVFGAVLRELVPSPGPPQL